MVSPTHGLNLTSRPAARIKAEVVDVMYLQVNSLTDGFLGQVLSLQR